MAGVGLSEGYLNADDLTHEKFLWKNFQLENGIHTDRLYKTGDLGYYRDDGCIMFVGRKDYQVKVRNYLIIIIIIFIKTKN